MHVVTVAWDQGAVKHGRWNALINVRATCDAQWDWCERAFFKKQSKIFCPKLQQKTTTLTSQKQWILKVKNCIDILIYII